MEQSVQVSAPEHHTALIHVSLIHTDHQYEQLFPPLSPSEYVALRESIQQAGIVTPICVARRDSGYVVLDGHHRLKVARELNIATVPCTISTSPVAEVELAYQLNLQRRHLTEEQRARLSSEYQSRLKAARALATEKRDIVEQLKEMIRAGAISSERLASLSEHLPVAHRPSETADDPKSDRAKEVADLQSRLQKAAREFRKLMEERDCLREALEAYERNEFVSANSVNVAIEHVKKELLESNRRLAEMSKQIQVMTAERERLQDQLRLSREREAIWNNGERRLLSAELEQTQQENRRLRAMLDIHAKTVFILNAITHQIKELNALLDHMVDPWDESQRHQVALAYNDLTAAWEQVYEPFSLALGGLPPGRTVFDRMFPDRRHRESLDRYVADDQNCSFNGQSKTAAKRRSRTESVEDADCQHPGL